MHDIVCRKCKIGYTQIEVSRHSCRPAAENAKSSVNVDMERPYAARVNADLAPTPAARLTSDLSTPTATSLLARLNTSFRSSRSSQSNYATSRSNTNRCVSDAFSSNVPLSRGNFPRFHRIVKKKNCASRSMNNLNLRSFHKVVFDFKIIL